MEDKQQGKIEVVMSGGCFDCGGKCPYKVYTKDGVPFRIEPFEQLKACARGYCNVQRTLSPDRLKYPLKKVGPRGYSDSYERISWDEALDRIANELKKVKEKYGNSSILTLTASGSPGRLYSPAWGFRLLNKFGGHTMRWASYSGEAGYFSGKVTYGTAGTQNSRDDMVNSKLIILWGVNPANTIWGTDTPYHISNAKQAGARVIVVDPRFQDSAATWADQWIPIRPSTDAAMLVAMAYVMIKENLHDQKFLDKYTIGFDKFRDYVLGVEDGVPKTPAWAENICGTSANDIEGLAREYAKTKPAMLFLGYAAGRTAYGEQTHRAAAVLACMTANVGKSGGGPGNSGMQSVGISFGPTQPAAPCLVPAGLNPLDPDRDITSLNPYKKNKSMIHASSIWDAVLKGKKGGYPADIKLIWVMYANPLNQVANVNKGLQAIKNVDFIVVQDQFMTPTARVADIVLPVTTHFERDDYERPWNAGDYHIFAHKVMDPPGEAKSDIWIIEQVAERLGIKDFWDSEEEANKTEDEWLQYVVSTAQEAKRDLPPYEEFKKSTPITFKLDHPIIAFKKQIEDIDNNPFATPSGKIEIYSKQLEDMHHPGIPAIPKYVEPWEGPNDPLAKKYPFQLITFHFRSRAHASFEYTPWLKELEPQVVWLNTRDAMELGIEDGEKVNVFNDRGSLYIQAYVTERIMPGVVAIGQGAYYDPDEKGVDRGGNPNMLTRDLGSPGGAYVTNTALVQVRKI